MHEKYAKDGLAVVSVNLDDPTDKDRRKEVLDFLKAKGRSLPTISCQERRGVTMSCSMVPTSFSRTMPIEERTMVRIISTIARTAGTKNQRLRRSGLYQTREASSIPAGGGCAP
ncbi:MAG: hypothetical protein L0Z62_21065, partial [Gemmataceae bacterium]|nr:hypothetical protein [Gemmataceae bacterium]